jgi:hypothetical protein
LAVAQPSLDLLNESNCRKRYSRLVNAAVVKPPRAQQGRVPRASRRCARATMSAVLKPWCPNTLIPMPNASKVPERT